MTYEEAIGYLHGLQRLGVKLGLERTRELLRRLGNPERRAGRIIHITGTSGKGSVSAMVESGLRAAGHRVGLYTSPALERFTERMQINRQAISLSDVAAAVSAVKAAIDTMVADGHEQPTEFETITVVGFHYFAQQQVDYLVLEVGVGGLYDATNVIENPVVTCITNIGLDHTDWLGDTHEKIAREKAGIIKPAVPCVTGTEHAGALEVIREVALSHNAVLMEVSTDDFKVTSFGPDGQMVDLLGARGWYSDVQLALLGGHQAYNAAVAVRVLELAGVSEQQIREGLRSVVWAGRFEVVALPGGRSVLFDAAHNAAKCQALADAVRAYFPGRRVLLVLGALADKEVEAMARPLLALADQVWITTPENPRAMDALALAQICQQMGRSAIAEPDIRLAVDLATAAAGDGDLVVITGSFYTVGPARRYLFGKTGRA